ncbi:hypothetical protein Tco_1051587 [Tanacetum coccineum]
MGGRGGKHPHPHPHQQQKKSAVKIKLIVVICVGLLGAALIADLLWASSTSSFSNNNNNNNNIISPLNPSSNYSSSSSPKRILSKTFADLPGPQLDWDKMTDAPVPRLDGAAIQIKDQLFVFAGYGTIDLVIPPTLFQTLFSLSRPYY